MNAQVNLRPVNIKHNAILYTLVVAFLFQFPLSGICQKPSTQRAIRSKLIPENDRILSRLFSPNGVVGIQVDIQNNELGYWVLYNKKPLAGRTCIGLLVDDADLGKGATLIRSSLSSKKIEKIAVRSTSSLVVAKYTQATLSLLSGTGRAYELLLRVYDDGLAWRFVVKGSGQYKISGEPSSFSLPAGANVWFTLPDVSYEGIYKQCRVEELKPDEQLMLPVVFRSNEAKLYGAITEAHLSGFVGIRLRNEGKGVLGFDYHDQKTFEVNGEIVTPWRLMMLGKNLNALVNNSLILSLSPRPDSILANATWIQPSRLGWSWMAGGGANGVNLENMKRYARACADLGFEGNLVDEGWSHWGGGGEKAWDMVRELVNYSNSLGVKTWLWKSCPDRAGIPGIFDSLQRDGFFRKCAEIGVAGVKLDFLNSEGMKEVAFMENALKDAANYHLMVIIHGCNKPTGTDYTWPNEMSREGIRGQEYGVNASLDQRHPFGRLLTGHGDYSPFWCNPTDRVADGAGTRAHNLATIINYTSAVLLPCEHPERIRDMPEAEFFKSVPLVWDDTKVLPMSGFGQCAAMARRKSGSWFVGITNDKNVSTKRLSLSFLGKGAWFAEIHTDSHSDRNQSKLVTKIVKSSDVLNVNMLSYGGWCARFSKMVFNKYGGKFTPGEKLLVTTSSSNAVVHYTFDGTEPVAASPSYPKGGITLLNSCTLRVKIISGDGAGAELAYYFNCASKL